MTQQHTLKALVLLIATAISGSAFAESSVKIGGKFDAGYQFKQSPGTTSETLGDGSASTSRITVSAKEDLMPGWQSGVNLDLRFGTIEEGKTGINSNDKKELYLSSPYGIVSWGVMNLAGQKYALAQKPYMVSPKDLEIVKFGVSQNRETSLTNRVTQYVTPKLSLGSFQTLAVMSYAFGDNHKSGTNNNTPGARSGDAKSLALEFKVGNIVDGGWNISHRSPSDVTKEDGMVWRDAYVSVYPLNGLKVFGNYNVYKGHDSATQVFKDKNYNLGVSYNWNGKLEVGIARSRNGTLGDIRNSGHATMLGAAYFLSKSTYLYVATMKTDYEQNSSTKIAKYDGTKAGFASTLTTADGQYTRIGIVKEF